MRSFIISAVFVALVASQIDAQEKLKPLADMTMLKVGGKTTRQEFLKMFPNATVNKSDDAEFGVRTYSVIEEDGSGGTTFDFLGDELSDMRTVWIQKNTIRDKAWVSVVNKLTEKYGSPDEKLGNDGQYRWSQPKHMLVSVVNNDAFAVQWISKEHDQKLQDLKAKKRANKLDK